MARRPSPFFCAACSLLLLQAAAMIGPHPALALQTHLGREGIYVHQGAHLFFTFAMIVFALNIHRSELSAQKPWRFFLWGALLFATWNIWAFTGHIIEYLIPPQHFVFSPTPLFPRLLISSWPEKAYYFLKMDHLLCLPGVIFFYLALKAILKDLPEKKERSGEAQ